MISRVQNISETQKYTHVNITKQSVDKCRINCQPTNSRNPAKRFLIEQYVRLSRPTRIHSPATACTKGSSRSLHRIPSPDEALEYSKSPVLVSYINRADNLHTWRYIPSPTDARGNALDESLHNSTDRERGRWWRAARPWGAPGDFDRLV
jgi:hypothetical protein